jgi:hypothetical protein
LKRKNSEKMMKKLQAAMEYLMTYGWAILIIALALGVLYSLGVLNPSRLKPVMCMLPAPFSCQIQSFNTAGVLSITLAQGSGQTIYINKIACVDNSLLTGTGGLPTAGWTTINQALASGSTITIPSSRGLKCYITSTSTYTGPMGSSFGGTLAINYSVGSSSASPYYFTMGSINAQVNTP